MARDVFDNPPLGMKRDAKARGWLKPNPEKQAALKQRAENRTLKAQMEQLMERLAAVEAAGNSSVEE